MSCLHQALAPSSGAQLPPYGNSSPNSWSADLVLNNLISLCFSTLFILVPWCFALRACHLPGFNLDLPDDALFSSPAVLSLLLLPSLPSAASVYPGEASTLLPPGLFWLWEGVRSRQSPRKRDWLGAGFSQHSPLKSPQISWEVLALN